MSVAEVIKPTQQVGLMFNANSSGWLGVHCLSQQVKMVFEGCLLLFIG